MHVGILYSRIREDEKLLLGELRERGHDVTKVDVRDHGFALAGTDAPLADCDIVVDRCLATSRSVYLTRFCESYGVRGSEATAGPSDERSESDGAPVVNSAETAAVCADKAKTSLALADAGVPTPDTTVAFTTESALDAIEAYGYPCVLKPVVGSWGRLMAKVESRNAAEAILEHKATLGHYEHSVFYVQKFVPKPGRDIRVLAADGEPIAAMTRSGDHWLTNAAKGGETAAFGVDDEVTDLVAAASDAVGGGLLGIDLMEREAHGASKGSSGDPGEPRDGYTVHEVNHTVEFKALNQATGVDVPAEVVDWLETKAAVQTEVTA